MKEEKKAEKETKKTKSIGEEKKNGENRVLSYLKRNEEIGLELLDSLKFIKRYYFWRSIFNGIKIAIVILVVILGIVSWDSIVEFFNSSTSNVQQNFYEAVKEGVEEKFNNR